MLFGNQPIRPSQLSIQYGFQRIRRHIEEKYKDALVKIAKALGNGYANAYSKDNNGIDFIDIKNPGEIALSVRVFKKDNDKWDVLVIIYDRK